MPTLTDGQIAALAKGVGLDPQQATVAVAVALAESRGRSDAVGDVAIQTATWGPSIGLWQIRSLKAERGTGGTRDADRLTDPQHNARSMATVSGQGRNWRPWTVYTTGRYLAYVERAEIAVGTDPGYVTPIGGTVGIPIIGEALDDVAGGAAGPLAVARFLAGLVSRATFVRAMELVFGGLALIVGLLMLARDLTFGGAVKAIRP